MPLSEIVLVLMGLLAVGMLAAGLFRRLPIPYTVLLVLIGMGLEALAGVWEPLHPLLHFRLTPELVLFIFLPTLIFESGFNLNARQLIKDIAPVMVLAVPALLISTAVVGLGMWLLLPMELTTALLFGALISATDPVAVIALFKELGAPLRLTVLVEGESLLNDATAIVVFNILLGIALFGGMQWSDAGLAAGQFVKVFFGGTLVGAGFGLLLAWLMTRLRIGTAGIIILSMVMAYVSFILAEHTLHVSGVMAVAGAAVTLGVFGAPRLPKETGTALGETWEFLALICNTLLFLLVGLSVDLGTLVSRLDYILLTVVLVLVARASTIYTLVPSATRLFGLPRVTMGERHIMWWGGLKGGLAIAIALSIPDDLPGKPLILDLTLGVVLFTLLVNAPTIRPLIRRLGIDRLTDTERAELRRGITLAENQGELLLERFRMAGLLSRAGHHQARDALRQSVYWDTAEVAEEHRLRRERLNALRAELEALEGLYKAGVIPQYTFLDLHGELQRKREHVAQDGVVSEHVARRQANPFLSLERGLVRRLREQDWAAGLLARYQNVRVSQHLLKDIARILMTEAAQQYLRTAEDIDESQREELEAIYRPRMADFRARVAAVHRDFPEFYQRFELHLSLRAALVRGLAEAEEESRQGGIGAKPFTLLERLLHQALEAVPPLSVPLAALEPRDLVAMVPLLAGLPSAALEDIARRVRPVNFLAGDTVIGQGEHGDALYIVAKGRVGVSRKDDDGEETPLAELDAGDFFGEMALLGEQVRTASVRALHACTLLRLTRKDVLAMAEEHPAIARRLQEAQSQRSAEPASAS